MISIRPFDEAPPFLGGGTPTSPDAVLPNLVRVRALPALPKLRGVDNPNLKRLYKQLGKGEFDARWEMNDDIDIGALIILFYAATDLPNDESKASESNGDDGLPEISSMKVGAIKTELALYRINTSKFTEKSELVSALASARESAQQDDPCLRRILFRLHFHSDSRQQIFKFGDDPRSRWFSLLKSIPKDAKEVLGTRLGILFFRHAGSKLPKEVSPRLARYFLSRMGTSQLAVSMDVASTLADVYCSQEQEGRDYTSETGMALVRAGEVLEAGSEFLAAAEVYLLNAKEGPFTSDRSNNNHSVIVGYAALAKKRAADDLKGGDKSKMMELLYQAEELYLRSAATSLERRNGQLGDVNFDGDFTNLWTNAMNLYESISLNTPIGSDLRSNVPDAVDGERRANEDEKMIIVLGALLNVIGLRNLTGFAYSSVVVEGEKSIVLLKDEFRSQAGAKKLYVKALSAPSGTNVRQYARSVFLSALSEEGSEVIFQGKDEVSAAKLEHEKDFDASRGAKEYFDGLPNSSQTMFTCDGPGCDAFDTAEGGKLRSCPCKTVYYCSVDCQAKHWPKHKKMCAHHKKKKDQKKSGK